MTYDNVILAPQLAFPDEASEIRASERALLFVDRKTLEVRELVRPVSQYVLLGRTDAAAGVADDPARAVLAATFRSARSEAIVATQASGSNVTPDAPADIWAIDCTSVSAGRCSSLASRLLMGSPFHCALRGPSASCLSSFYGSCRCRKSWAMACFHVRAAKCALSSVPRQF